MKTNICSKNTYMSGLGELYPSFARLGLGGAFTYVGPASSPS